MHKLAAVAALALLAACSDATAPEAEPEVPQVGMVHFTVPPSMMKSGYSMECSGPTSRPLCLIKYLGAGIATIATPEACVTVVACAGAIAGTTMAWVDYFNTPDCEGCGPYDRDPRFEHREERVDPWW